MRSENAPSTRRNALRTLLPLSAGAREMQNDFAIRCCLENGAFAFQFIAQQIGVDEIAVVRDRHLAAQTIDHEWLRIFERARSGGGIARVPDRAYSSL